MGAETVKQLKENARIARIFHWLLSTTDMMRDWRSASALLLSRRAVKYLTKKNIISNCARILCQFWNSSMQRITIVVRTAILGRALLGCAIGAVHRPSSFLEGP